MTKGSTKTPSKSPSRCFHHQSTLQRPCNLVSIIRTSEQRRFYKGRFPSGEGGSDTLSYFEVVIERGLDEVVPFTPGHEACVSDKWFVRECGCHQPLQPENHIA
ncbi:hypothetical protein M404DRAFT_1003975, partial [Pisolithus tinctorius Marx 270]